MLCIQDLSLCEQAEQTMEQEENVGGDNQPPPSPGLEANTGEAGSAPPILLLCCDTRLAQFLQYS